MFCLTGSVLTAEDTPTLLILVMSVYCHERYSIPVTSEIAFTNLVDNLSDSRSLFTIAGGALGFCGASLNLLSKPLQANRSSMLPCKESNSPYLHSYICLAILGECMCLPWVTISPCISRHMNVPFYLKKPCRCPIHLDTRRSQTMMETLTLFLAFFTISLTTALPQPEHVGQEQLQHDQLNVRVIPTPSLTLSYGGLHTIEGRSDPIPTPTNPNKDAPTLHPRSIPKQATTMNRGVHFTSTTPALPEGGEHWMDQTIPPLTMTVMDKDKRDNAPTAIPTPIVMSYITVTVCPETMPQPRLYSHSHSSSAATITTAPLYPPNPSLHSRPYPSPSPLLPRQNQPQQPLPLPLPSPFCSTTLTPLAAPAITITDCEQRVTFSTEYGYRLLPQPTDGTATQINDGASRAIETVRTFFIAPWYELSYGAVPTGVETVVGATHILASSVWVEGRIEVAETRVGV